MTLKRDHRIYKLLTDMGAVLTHDQCPKYIVIPDDEYVEYTGGDAFYCNNKYRFEQWLACGCVEIRSNYQQRIYEHAQKINPTPATEKSLTRDDVIDLISGFADSLNSKAQGVHFKDGHSKLNHAIYATAIEMKKVLNELK